MQNCWRNVDVPK